MTVAGKRYGPERGLWQGTVKGLDHDKRWIEIDTVVPGDVNAACIYVSNHAYSRNTAYRIAAITPVDAGTRIGLGTQPMLLGQGRIHEIADGNTILSDIPHEYGRSVVGGTNPRFFDGKRLFNGRGAETNLRTAVFGSPVKLQVESIQGFDVGDTLYYYDVQVGDTVTIPTAWDTTNP